MSTPLRAIGLMSGTSMDGVDVALMDTDGRDSLVFGPMSFRAYTAEQRAVLRESLELATTLIERTARPGALAEAERLVTEAHAAAVSEFLAGHDLDPAEIDVIGFHGQTVLHRPQDRLTVQIGDGQRLAGQLGIRVMADMRAADVAAGGQGAPLVPIFHQALVRESNLPEPTLVINIGGVANVSFVSKDHDPIAFDTGPGNALIDDLLLQREGVAFDQNGRRAASGTVDAAALDRLMDHPFFAAPLPKSLDRNAFSRKPVDLLATADAAATLTAFTASTISASLQLLPEQPNLAVVCGGGALNATMMASLRERLPCPVKTAEEVGWSGEAVEAQAFAYLAVRALQKLPLTFPSTTGVSKPMTGGVLFEP